MRCLVTTSKAVLLVSFSTGAIEIICQGHGPYYGLTWSADRVFVTVQRDERVLEIDATRVIGSFPLSSHNVHGACFRNDTLFVCDSGHDRLLGFNLEQQTMLNWLMPEDRPHDPKRGADQHHINTVWANDHELWVVQHNWEHPSVAVQVDEHGGIKQTWVIAQGGGAHDFAKFDGQMYACDSRQGVIVSATDTKRREIHIKPFLRGLAVLNDGFIVGVSNETHDPSERLSCDGELLWLRPDGSIRRRVLLPGYGQILVVRAIGEIDWAHHGDKGPACPIA